MFCEKFKYLCHLSYLAERRFKYLSLSFDYTLRLLIFVIVWK